MVYNAAASLYYYFYAQAIYLQCILPLDRASLLARHLEPATRRRLAFDATRAMLPLGDALQDASYAPR